MSAYYNEIDRKAAQWLRELIRAGHLPEGEVDERSIADVEPVDLAGFDQCHFFAGIGGWPYALRLAGWDDRRPVWTGSAPCQPFSAAGKREGASDERHLWPLFADLISQCGPPIVLGEQVASSDARAWLTAVRADLDQMGYAVGAADLCAAGVGAPHIRQRLYWVAYNGSEGLEGRAKQSAREELTPAQRGGDAGGLEVADGGNTSAEREQRSREQRLQPSCGGDGGRVGNSEQLGAGRHAGAGTQAQGGCSLRAVGDGSGTSSATGQVGNSELHGSPPDRCEVGGTEKKRRVLQSQRSGWDDVLYVPCADGRTRPVKPGIEPLVDGLPGRVGLLRGYGNAIVPQVAKVFIETVMEYEAR